MIFGIGDIHGQRVELERALETIADDPAHGAPIVCIGDYTDRGPDSRGVLDLLIALKADGADVTCIRGNHDAMLLEFLEAPAMGGREAFGWLSDNIGGRETVASYGIDTDLRRPVRDLQTDFRAAVPAAHLAFLRALPTRLETATQFFCHAGIKPGVAFANQNEQDLIWIREPFLSSTRDHGKLVVHGHTPGEAPCHYGNRLNLDGGAGYGRKLVPVLIDGLRAFALRAGARCEL